MGERNSQLSVALISSEAAPFAKTGGLGDMVGSLAPALKSLGVDPFLVFPRYATAPLAGFSRLDSRVEVPSGNGPISAAIWKGRHPRGLVAYAVDIPAYFDRPGFYGEGGRDYADNAQRFAAFCRVLLEMIRVLGLPVRILHLHDWQTAPIALALKSKPGIRSVLTIHNLGYQGLFPASVLAELPESERRPFEASGEFFGRINFLKAGILTANAVTTVSPTYAAETLGSELGYGLEGVLRSRDADYFGILNGIDTIEWDPSTDAHLPARYSAADLSGKAACKAALQREMGLPVEAETPLIATIGRFVDQKGIDLAAQAVASLNAQNALNAKTARLQWVVLGNGDHGLEEMVRGLSRSQPGRVAATISFDAPLAHRIEAGADFFLMPSRYEPCGYNQMYSLRYGTIPIVRSTGGLKDTVRDISKEETGTGIVFERAAVEDVVEALNRALALYADTKALTDLRLRGMRQDFSWRKSAVDYVRLYEKIVTARP